MTINVIPVFYYSAHISVPFTDAEKMQLKELPNKECMSLPYNQLYIASLYYYGCRYIRQGYRENTLLGND